MRPGAKAALIAALTVLGGGAAAAMSGGGNGMGSLPSVTAPTYDPSADYARGVAALKAQQYRDAARAFDRVSHATPDAAEIWRLLGEARAGDQDWKGARRAYERAVKLEPDDPGGHAGLGLAMARMKDAKAHGELDWLTAKAQACGAACPEAARLKSLRADLEAAIAGAAPSRPSAALQGPMLFAGFAVGDAAYSQAVSLINEKRYDAALAALGRAGQVFGPHPDILTYQGYAWRKKGDWSRAERYYRQALEIAPDHRGATEYYGELKVERGDLAAARRLLARLDHMCAYGCAEAEELRLWIDRRGDPRA